MLDLEEKVFQAQNFHHIIHTCLFLNKCMYCVHYRRVICPSSRLYFDQRAVQDDETMWRGLQKLHGSSHPSDYVKIAQTGISWFPYKPENQNMFVFVCIYNMRTKLCICNIMYI